MSAPRRDVDWSGSPDRNRWFTHTTIPLSFLPGLVNGHISYIISPNLSSRRHHHHHYTSMRGSLTRRPSSSSSTITTTHHHLRTPRSSSSSQSVNNYEETFAYRYVLLCIRLGMVFTCAFALYIQYNNMVNIKLAIIVDTFLFFFNLKCLKLWGIVSYRINKCLIDFHLRVDERRKPVTNNANQSINMRYVPIRHQRPEID